MAPPPTHGTAGPNSAGITLAVDLLDNGLPAHAIASLGASGANPTAVVQQFDVAEVVRHCVKISHPNLAAGVTMSVGGGRRAMRFRVSRAGESSC
jgi:hypothetical protein